MIQQAIISATQAWLSTFVIAYNICPFAKKVFEDGSIRFRVVDSLDLEECLQALILECLHLDAVGLAEEDSEAGKGVAAETTLLIFAEAVTDFEDFLDLLEIAEQLLIEQGYEGIYQLASFHPEYRFAGANRNDPANYTNRSPYPMLHIIREASIERALESYPNPEQIPERNIALTRQIGLEKLRAELASINSLT